MEINKDPLKQRVKNIVKFKFFEDYTLVYECFDGFEFKIPAKDTVNEQGAQPRFNAEEKRIIFMRWIRKEMESQLKEK
jgi:hypothetical protein